MRGEWGEKAKDAVPWQYEAKPKKHESIQNEWSQIDTDSLSVVRTGLKTQLSTVLHISNFSKKLLVTLSCWQHFMKYLWAVSISSTHTNAQTSTVSVRNKYLYSQSIHWLFVAKRHIQQKHPVKFGWIMWDKQPLGAVSEQTLFDGLI